MLPKLWRPLVLSLTSLLVVGAGPTVLAGPVDSDGPEDLSVADIAETDPLRIIDVVVNFDVPPSSTDITRLATGFTALQLFSGFRAPSSDYVGGYVLGQDESVEEALAKYAFAQSDMVNTAVDQAVTTLETTDDPAWREHLGDLLAWRANLDSVGVQLVGVVLRGPADAAALLPTVLDPGVIGSVLPAQGLNVRPILKGYIGINPCPGHISNCIFSNGNQFVIPKYTQPLPSERSWSWP
jgi:hypothetical protein